MEAQRVAHEEHAVSKSLMGCAVHQTAASLHLFCARRASTGKSPCMSVQASTAGQERSQDTGRLQLSRLTSYSSCSSAQFVCCSGLARNHASLAVQGSHGDFACSGCARSCTHSVYQHASCRVAALVIFALRHSAIRSRRSLPERSGPRSHHPTIAAPPTALHASACSQAGAGWPHRRFR